MKYVKTFENFSGLLNEANKPKDIIKEFNATTGDVDIICTLTLKWVVTKDMYVGKLSYNLPKPQLKLYIPTIDKLKKQVVEYCTEVASEYKVEMKE